MTIKIENSMAKAFQITAFFSLGSTKEFLEYPLSFPFLKVHSRLAHRRPINQTAEERLNISHVVDPCENTKNK
jgi:hypothetical protein